MFFEILVTSITITTGVHKSWKLSYFLYESLISQATDVLITSVCLSFCFVSRHFICVFVRGLHTQQLRSTDLMRSLLSPSSFLVLIAVLQLSSCFQLKRFNELVIPSGFDYEMVFNILFLVF